jgi:hypothetical protein
MSAKDLLKIALVVTLVASAGTAFAAGSTIDGATSIIGGSFTPSANVTLHVASGTSSYAADSSHLSGNRIYFGNNSDSKIYYSTKNAGATSELGVTSTMGASAGWSSL